MSKSLPHVFTVTVPLIAGVKAYQIPLPKLGWHVGTGSPVAVAFAVLSVLVTPADSTIAPRHRSFTGVGVGVGVGDGLGVGVGDGDGVGEGVGLGVGLGDGVGVGLGVGDGVGLGVGVGVGVGDGVGEGVGLGVGVGEGVGLGDGVGDGDGVSVGVGVGVSTGVGVGVGVSSGVGVGSWAYVIAVTKANTRQIRINLRGGLSVRVPIACLALGGVHCYIFGFAVKHKLPVQGIRISVTAA